MRRRRRSSEPEGACQEESCKVRCWVKVKVSSRSHDFGLSKDLGPSKGMTQGQVKDDSEFKVGTRQVILNQPSTSGQLFPDATRNPNFENFVNSGFRPYAR